MSRRRFTDEQYREIAALRERGWGAGRIAAKFECSVGLINWTCLRLGADPPKARPLPDRIVGPALMSRKGHEVRRFTADEDARLLALEGAGLTYCAIAKQLGRKHNSIRGRLMTLARREARREAA